MKPKGKLLIIGGGENISHKKHYKDMNDEFDRYEILKELLPRSLSHRIEIITSGSLIQDQVKKIYQKAFHRIGYLNPDFIQIRRRREANSKEYLDRIQNAAGVFFTGGDQSRIRRLLIGTPLIELIKLRYLKDPDFLIAGTSAGAMVLSEVMIKSGGKKEALIGKDLATCDGFNILKNCVIDTHFIKRGRFSRLAHAVIKSPKLLGIGLGENTALIIKNGTETECRGSGMVIIIDGRLIKECNFDLAKPNDPIFVANLKVHLLVKNCYFSLKTHKIFVASQRKKETK